MRKISIFGSLMFVLLFCSCNDMYNSITDFVEEEKVYPGGFDLANGRIGYERVEIDLLYAGRIPAGEIRLGKAKNTVIEYDNELIPIDSLCSWVNVKELKKSKLYRIKVYTTDEFGNKSIPVETALIPYTEDDKNNLTIPSPRIAYQPGEASVSWNSNLNSVVLNYYELSFSYTDKSGASRTGTRTGQTPSFTADNLASGPVTVSLKHKVVPKVNNVAIIDTVYLENSLVLSIP